MRKLIYFCLLCINLCLELFAANTIKVAWVPRLPYSYETRNYGVAELKGLDIEIMQELARRLNMSVTFIEASPKDLPTLIHNKSIDAVLGFTRGSYENLVWTNSYRIENYVVYMPPTSKTYFYTTEQLLQSVTEANPLGLTISHTRLNPTLGAFIHDPANQNKLRILTSETQLLEKFLEGSLKTFIGDRVVFSTLLHKLRQWRYVHEIKLDLNAEIGLGVVTGSPLAKDLDHINATIDQMGKDGKLNRVFTEYLTPAVLMHTIDEGWLRFIEFMGIIAFTIYAFIHGFYRHMAFIKTIGFTIVLVFTGPVLKDVLTTGQIEFFRNPTYLTAVIGIVFVAHSAILTLRNLSYRQIRTYILSENKDRWIQEVACAVGLASYSVSGVLYAITSADTSWFWEGMLGTITATSGLLFAHQLYKVPSKINFLFAEISFGWGVLLALYFSLSRSTVNFDQDSIFIAVMIVLFGIFLCRMLALYHQLSSIGFGRKLRETLNKL